MINDAVQIPSYAWYLATWRNLPPQPRPEPPAFDIEEKLKKIRRYKSWRWDRIWSKPSVVLSAEEARFWMLLINSVDHYSPKPQEVADKVAERWAAGEQASSDMRFYYDRYWWNSPIEAIIPLYNLFPLPEVIEQLRCAPAYQGQQNTLLDGWRQYIVPILTPDERQQVRDLIRPEVELGMIYNAQSYQRDETAKYRAHTFELAASVGGFNTELEAALAQLTDNFLDASYYYPDYVYFVLGLDSRAAMSREMRRLGGYLARERQVFAWLAHTETSELDWVARATILQHQKKKAVAWLRLLGRVKDPATAPCMLQLGKESKAPEAALQWLNDHPDLTIRGLQTLAQEGDEAACKQLKRLAQHGHEALLREVNPELAETLLVAEEAGFVPLFSAETTPEWLTQTIKGNLPAWLDIPDLPPIVVDAHQLTPVQRTTVLLALKSCRLTGGNVKTHSLITSLREHGEPTYLDAFVWALFQQWMAIGAPTKEKWALLAVGLLGNDSSALKLTPLVRKWPGESQHHRAVFALECLRMIGSDTALMQINGLATKNRYQGLKKRAKQAIGRIAKARGLSTDQLADRIIPDCGLDETGQRTFDYGARTFTFALSDEVKPVVRDEKGKVRANLPKPSKRDDAVKATAAYEAWKLIKKQVRDLLKVQVVRLQQAMISQRRWTATEFETLLVQHPVMTHLVQRLVWGGFDEAGTRVQSLRVTDERDFSDVEDEPIELDGVVAVGVLHPLQLDSAERADWGELLSDYDIIPPFPQLGRQVNTLTEEERQTDTLHRLENLKIPSITLRGILERSHWVRDTPADAGGYYGHSRPFPFANVTAVITYEEGLFVGGYDIYDHQTVTGCFFVPGLYEPRMYPRHKARVPLGEVSPMVVSEVLSLLHVLAGKAEKI